MAAISIHREEGDGGTGRFRAVAGEHHSIGQTPGEALDSLIAREGSDVESSLILIQRFVPDAYFTQAQYDQMKALLDRKSSLTEAESEALDALIDAELDATVFRSKALLKRSRP
jgi:hypothetical protein